MAHSLSSCLIHYVFSTKGRRKTITAEMRERLWPFMGGIARDNHMKAIAIGGSDDHAHLLISLPATLSVAAAIKQIKGGSSRWIHDTFPDHREFEWQEGYGAFSIGISGVADTTAYIQKQEEHHQTVTFEDEYRAFLKRHDLHYDEKYIWG